MLPYMRLLSTPFLKSSPSRPTLSGATPSSGQASRTMLNRRSQLLTPLAIVMFSLEPVTPRSTRFDSMMMSRALS